MPARTFPAPSILCIVLPSQVSRLLLTVNRRVACREGLGFSEMMLGVYSSCNGAPMLLQHKQ